MSTPEYVCLPAYQNGLQSSGESIVYHSLFILCLIHSIPLILHFKHRSTISHVDDDTKSPETVTRDRVEQRPLGIAVRSLVLLRYDATVDEGP